MKSNCIVLFILFAFMLQAQISIKINSKEYKYPNEEKGAIEEYNRKIDSLIKVEKAQMKAELEWVNEAYSNGTITKEEMKNQKEEIAEQFAQRIETKVDSLADELEEIIQEQVEISLYSGEDWITGSISEDEVNIEIKKEKRKYKKVSHMIFTTQLGFSNLSNGWELNSSSDIKTNFGKSVAFTFGPLLQYQPTITSPFTLITGLQFRTNNIRADKGYYFIDNNQDQSVLIPAPYEDIRKAKLRTNSLQIPIGFKYSFRNIETDEETETQFRNVKKGFYVGMMFYGGLNLSSKSIVKYKNEDNHRRKDKYDVSSVNNILYGLEFDMGYKGYNFYFRKDLNDFFNKTTLPVNQNFEFGMRFGF